MGSGERAVCAAPLAGTYSEEACHDAHTPGPCPAKGINSV